MNADVDLRRQLILPAFGIHQAQLELPAFSQRHLGDIDIRVAGVGNQFEDFIVLPDVVALPDEFRCRDRLVQVETIFQLGPLHGGHAARVLDAPMRHAGVGGIIQLRVRAFQSRMLKNAQAKIPRPSVAKLNPIKNVVLNVGQGAAKNRIVEILNQLNALGRVGRGAKHQPRLRGQRLFELGQNHDRAAFFHRRVTRRHLHAVDAFHHVGQRGFGRRGAHERQTRHDAKKQNQREMMRATGEEKILHVPLRPGVLVVVIQRLADHAILKIIEMPRAGVGLLLQRSQQESIQPRIMLFDLMRDPFKIDIKCPAAKPDRHGCDHAADQQDEKGVGRPPVREKKRGYKTQA